MQKPPQITFKNMEPSPALETLIRDHVESLERMHPRLISCRVVVEVPHRAAETGKVPIGISVEVQVPGRGMVVAKEEQERHEAKDDRTAPVTRAFDAIERQLDKLADIQNHDVKTHEAEPESGMVVRLFPDRQFGFIQVDNTPELYFTRNAVVGGDFDELEVGSLVAITRATTEGPMGPQASSVRLLDRRKAPA
jgi:ribosome-associated translation inhibitor RaiA/cold shock CspA family protein